MTGSHYRAQRFMSTQATKASMHAQLVQHITQTIQTHSVLVHIGNVTSK